MVVWVVCGYRAGGPTADLVRVRRARLNLLTENIRTLSPPSTPPQVVDTLLHPETVERLAAVRKFVETQSLDAPFPPQPDLDAVPGPLYGRVYGNLDEWRQRRVDVFTDGVAELLLTERQLQYYRWVCVWGR